ncbi:MAG: hypothetical protein HC869_11150 [Rhodospirillales bacterium]|nr:hypothetical protein [Rhodospirillales bacterium]
MLVGKRILLIVSGGIAAYKSLELIRRLRDEGLRVGALTNNWVGDDGHGTGHQLRSLFDVVVESSVVGLHKPDPGSTS